MKFKNKDSAEFTVLTSLSEKESEKYNLPSLVEITGIGMARTVAPGEYILSLDDFSADVTVDLAEDDRFFIAEGKMKDFAYKIIKDRPIRKYDLFRTFIINHESIKATAK